MAETPGACPVSMEPAIAETFARLVKGDMPDLVDWSQYLRCGVCGAPAGQACTAKFSTVQSGRPDGPPSKLTVAHGYRVRRRGR